MSNATQLLGATEPRRESYPEHSTGAGDAAIAFCRSLGVDLLPWQEHALSVMLGENDDQKWASREVGFIVSRQNGKGTVLMARALAGLFLFNEGLILHTAHEFKTAQEAFLRIAEVIDNNPELVAQLKGGRVEKGKRTSHGEEGYELANGSRLRFVARSKSSGRGFSADVVILDEALDLPEKAVAALRPTLLTRPNPQIIYTSSAGMPDSAVLRKVRERGLKSDEKRLAWMEWSAPDDALDDLSNREYWAMANPALGYLFDVEALEDQFNGRMTDEAFARETLSIWETEEELNPIDPIQWAARTDTSSKREGAFAIGIEIKPDRSAASISIAGRRSDGKFHAQVVHMQRGTRGFADKVAEIVAKRGGSVAVNASGPASSLIPELAELGVITETLTLREYAQSCAALADSVRDDQFRHIGQPAVNLALKHARTRSVGDLWLWATKGEADITPIQSLTIALASFRKTFTVVADKSGISHEMYSFA